MAKRLQIVYDLAQYGAVLEPLRREFEARGWEIVLANVQAYNRDMDVRGTIACQDGPWLDKKRFIEPSFLVFHGVSFVKSWRKAYSTSRWDYVIVPSRFFEEQLTWLEGNREIEGEPSVILGLGWPKADTLIRNYPKQALYRELIADRHGLDGRPIVLFAPTYKKKQFTGRTEGQPDKLPEVVSELPGCNVIFMPHQMCDYQNVFPEHRLRVDSAYPWKYEYLLGCDLLLADVSSVIFEVALIDKPIVLLDDPSNPDYLNIKMDGGERLDVGEVADMGNLREVVERHLNWPDSWAHRRRYWAEMALGYCDGQSTKKIVDKIEEVIGG
ncbi:CDP-glycerol glycerophosphotransferase family protein [Chloroflexota bacterium]